MIRHRAANINGNHTAIVFCYKVKGEPAPQGSKRYLGNGVMVESSKKVKPWREAIVWQVKPERMIEGPVSIAIAFSLAKPKSAKRVFPTVKPDLDKLIRSTLDGLKTAGLYRDDCQVVKVEALKLYTKDQELAGATIRVVEL